MIRFRERASLYRTSLVPSALAALQGCHFIITISGLSEALQPLITLSLSHRLAPALVSRSLQLPHVHVRRFSSSCSSGGSHSSSLKTATHTRSMILEFSAHWWSRSSSLEIPVTFVVSRDVSAQGAHRTCDC